MTMLWARHGETALNAARVLQPADTPLNATGHAQAAALAQRLRGAGLVAIVSSDLPRARQTADAIAAVTGLPVLTQPLLQERNFGDLRGQAWDSLGFDPLAVDDAPPGGESMAEFSQRVAGAFAWVVAQRAAWGGPLAVVTHGLVIDRVLRAHARLPAGLGSLQRPANTSLTELSALPPHDATLVACARHLWPSAASAPGAVA